MSKLTWDAVGSRFYETGVKQGVLYVQDSQGTYPTGVAWNGLTSISESPSGAEANAIYADNTKYLNLYSTEEFSATVEAYTYPEEFEQCDGSAELATGVNIGQQARKSFGLCYRTELGNDIQNEEYGYKLHIIYGCKASPSEKAYQTINDSPEAISFSWEINTTPVTVTGKKPTATVTIDSTKVDATNLAAFEDIIYGVEAPTFSATATYAVGDYCTYTSSGSTAKVYKCITAVTTPGEWSTVSSNFEEVTNPGPRLPLPAEIATLFASDD